MDKNMSDDIYKTPASNLEANIGLEETFKLESNLKFKKTIIMNIIGGVCFLMNGIALCFDKKNSEDVMSLLFLTIIYSVLCGSAFGSAYALRAQAGSRLQLVMLSINWLYVGIFIFGILIIIFPQRSDMHPLAIVLILAVFIFIIPHLLNINALKKIRKNRQKN